MIQNEWAKKCVEVQNEEEEILIVKMHTGKKPINIVTTYGKQEAGESEAKEEITQQMNMWEQAIIQMQIKGEHILWIGDLNVKVGNDTQGIKGNHSDVTYGGKMLRNIIKKRDLQLINATEKCRGLWTRINTGNKDQKSILDYVIANRKENKGDANR